ncbi:hypothetical protein, partial [Yersinia massiliensis]|uniref:hypothetical protein n=1 Tax=Yersinia massiliensis TaxID=419257 RepID=UPI001C95D402
FFFFCFFRVFGFLFGGVFGVVVWFVFFNVPVGWVVVLVGGVVGVVVLFVSVGLPLFLCLRSRAFSFILLPPPRRGCG